MYYTFVIYMESNCAQFAKMDLTHYVYYFKIAISFNIAY